MKTKILNEIITFHKILHLTVELNMILVESMVVMLKMFKRSYLEEFHNFCQVKQILLRYNAIMFEPVQIKKNERLKRVTMCA